MDNLWFHGQRAGSGSDEYTDDEKNYATVNPLCVNRPKTKTAGRTMSPTDEQKLQEQNMQLMQQLQHYETLQATKNNATKNNSHASGGTKKTTDKTPVSLLYEYATKAGDIVEFFEERSTRHKGVQLFQYLARVMTIAGCNYEERGQGTAKQCAKHDAARRMINRLYQDAENRGASHAAQQRKGEQDGDTVSRSEANGGEPSSQPSLRHKETGQGSKSISVKNAAGDDVNISKLQNQLIIRVKLQENGRLKLQTGSNAHVLAQQEALSLQEKVDCVKLWTGPKIEKLKDCSIAKLKERKDHVKIAEVISAEQNFCIEYAIFEGNRHGLRRYICLLQSRPKGEAYTYFTDYGYGETPELAKSVAARKFVKMLKFLTDFD